MNFAPWSAEPWRRLGEAQFVAGNLAAARASFRKAIAKDRRDWTLWFELAQASRGAERQRALARRLAPQPAQSRDRRSRGRQGADESLLRRDPLANPEALIRRVYAFAAYRLGDGPDAEDVTSEVFERALRYREELRPLEGRAGGLAARHRTPLHERRARRPRRQPGDREIHRSRRRPSSRTTAFAG